MTIFKNDPKGRMDDLLNNMAISIQLDETRYQRMKSAYESISKLLETDDQFFNQYEIEVYPQGSVRIGTTNKPLNEEDFDLDIVIHLFNLDWKKYSPNEIKMNLYRVLKNHGIYSDKVELKNRCIRINYKNEFHMDILLGCQLHPQDFNTIKIPDRELNDWIISNPKGYADWFLEKANTIQQSFLESVYAKNQLPIEDFKNKKPLQRAVQLLKKYRDEYFKDNTEYATSSIVLTTIAGHYYNYEISIFDTIDNIIIKIHTDLNNNNNNNNNNIKVYNPVNKSEDFTDKWVNEPKYLLEFTKFISHLYTQWQKLKNENFNLLNESTIMKDLFSKNTYEKGLDLHNSFIHENIKNKYSGLIEIAKPIVPTQKPYLK